ERGGHRRPGRARAWLGDRIPTGAQRTRRCSTGTGGVVWGVIPRPISRQGGHAMRLVLFEGPGAGRGIRPGVWTDAGVVDVSSATADLVAHSPQHLMTQIMDEFEARPLNM